MGKTIYVISLFLVVFTIGKAFPEEKVGGILSDSPNSQGSEIVISGKLFCTLKRQVIVPFHCTIISLMTRAGQKVMPGEVLARYRLSPEAELKLHRRVSSFHIQELEMQLAETNKNLARLEDNYSEIRQLSDHDMAPSHSMVQIEREIELLKKQQAFIQKRLPIERVLVKEDRAVVGKLLGNTVRHGHVPQEGTLKAPVGCRVIWVHPDLRKDAEFKKGTPAFSIGVMDPMLIRAQVHEIEVVQLNLGDVAVFTLESIPGREFEARVSRVSWASSTPQLDRPSYYDVELEVPNPDFILREGLRGRIIFRKKR